MTMGDLNLQHGHNGRSGSPFLRLTNPGECTISRESDCKTLEQKAKWTEYVIAKTVKALKRTCPREHPTKLTAQHGRSGSPSLCLINPGVNIARRT